MKNFNCESSNSFKMPSINQLIEFCTSYYTDWYLDFIDSIINRNHIDTGDNIKDKQQAARRARKYLFRETYNALKKELERIADGKTIARVIRVDDGKEYIKKAKTGKITDIGIHWTENFEKARYLDQMIVCRERQESIFLEAKASIECIDIEQSFSMRCMYPYELEITLKKECKVTVKKINYGGEFFKINNLVMI